MAAHGTVGEDEVLNFSQGLLQSRRCIDPFLGFEDGQPSSSESLQLETGQAVGGAMDEPESFQILGADLGFAAAPGAAESFGKSFLKSSH